MIFVEMKNSGQLTQMIYLCSFVLYEDFLLHFEVDLDPQAEKFVFRLLSLALKDFIVTLEAERVKVFSGSISFSGSSVNTLKLFHKFFSKPSLSNLLYFSLFKHRNTDIVNLCDQFSFLE